MRTAAPPPTRRSCSRPACSSIPSNPSASRRSNRSEEHTSELQSRLHLVCRLLLEKKKTIHSVSRQKLQIATVPHYSNPPGGMLTCTPDLVKSHNVHLDTNIYHA